MAGFLSKLFGGGGNKGTKKYEDIFFGALRMGQSAEYAFKQAIDSAMADKVFNSRKEAAQKLHELVLPRVEEAEHKTGLAKALARETK